MTTSEDDLRYLAETLRQSSNNLGIDDFEGFSPTEMNEIFYQPLADGCPVQLNKVDEIVYRQIPIFTQVMYILTRILEAGKIKLTTTGNLPVKLVADTYAQGFMKDELIESGIYKLYKEEDSMSIHLAHILLQLTGMVRKSKGYLFVTKKGEKLSTHPHDFLKAIFLAFGQQFNWSHFDGYGEQPIGQFGWLYSLFIVHKYGESIRTSHFYAEKYFIAFPALSQIMESESANNCYVRRSFDRFMFFFGLVTIEKGHWMDSAIQVKATPLLYSLLTITPPMNYQNKEMN